MSDLNDWVETLKRTVAPPSTFSKYYPDATDDDIAATLMDAFCEVQLDGFFTVGYSLDLDTGIIAPDLDQAALRLVTLFAAVNVVRAQLLVTKSRALFRASTAESDIEYSPNVLVKVLTSLETAKQTIVQRLTQSGAAFQIYMVDAYFVRAVAPIYDFFGYYDVNIDRAFDTVPWGL